MTTSIQLRTQYLLKQLHKPSEPAIRAFPKDTLSSKQEPVLEGCSYMEAHSKDSGTSKHKPYYTIKVHHATDDIYLVHRVSKKVVAEQLLTGGIYTFSAWAMHAVYPRELSDYAVAQQTLSNSKHKQAEKLQLEPDKEQAIKLVFEFM